MPTKRSSNIAITLFILVAGIELLTHLGVFPSLHSFTKPLLMPLLALSFILRIGWDKTYGRLIVLALLLSWVGDCFLLFDHINSLFFIFGLISFLLAHVVYIYIFRNTSGIQPIHSKLRWYLSFAFFVYGAFLVYKLWPSLNDLKIPVIVYAIVITTMGVTSIYRNVAGKYYVIFGALFFIISDSLLAFNKFDGAFPYARFLIMLTYIMAQVSISEGVIQFLKTSNSKNK